MNREQRRKSNLYFCDNGDVLAERTRRSLGPEKLGKIRLLQRLDTRQNWKIMLFAAMWALAGWCAVAVDSLLAQLPAMALMALCLNAITIFMHESCHSLLSKNPSLNRWIGFVCGAPGLVSASAYRSIHLAHHAFTKTEKDPDRIDKNMGKPVSSTLIHYAVLFVGIYFYLPVVAVVGFRRADFRARVHILTEYGLMMMVILLLAVAIPGEILLKLWIIPLLGAAQLSNVRGLAEHGLTTGGNEFTASRTIVSNGFVKFFMCNLNYHLEHHLFPGVPWYHLPRVHTLLRMEYREAGSSIYPSYTRFLIDFFKLTAAKKIVPDVRLIPAHLREEVCL